MIIIQVKNKGDEMRSFFTKIISSTHSCKITRYQRMTGLQPDFSQYCQKSYALNLLKLADRIDYTKREKPALLAVITANGFAYRREDGIAVIPIGVLTA